MKVVLLLVAILFLAWPVLAWSDDQMLAFSNISYKTGWTSSLAEEAMIRYSFDQIDYRTCKMVIDSANENIRIYNNLLETMFNVTIARKEKKPLYAI